MSSIRSVITYPGSCTMRLRRSVTLIKGIVVAPLVGRLPGGAAGVRRHVRRSTGPHKKENVTLIAESAAGKPSQIDSADPIIRDFKLHGTLPLAFAEPMFSDRRCGLGLDCERAHLLHMSPPFAPVISHPIEVDRYLGGRVGAEKNIN